MKLYLKEKVFSWSDYFTVKDEDGADRYYVKGEVFSWGKKLHIYDLNDREIVYIKQKMLSWMPQYEVYMDDQLVATVKKEFLLIFHRYRVYGVDWDVGGQFMAHEFEITQHGRPVAKISKEWMSWGDSYELDIVNPADALLSLAVVITIDCIMEDTSN